MTADIAYPSHSIAPETHLSSLATGPNAQLPGQPQLLAHTDEGFHRAVEVLALVGGSTDLDPDPVFKCQGRWGACSSPRWHSAERGDSI